VDELIDNVVNRYFQIDCAIFTPNQSRQDHVNEMAQNYDAQGVINYSLQFCHPYQHESITHAKQLEKEGVPVLNLTTDYSQEDVGQLKTRIEAFIERIKS
jgi:benzoyl-CoA reductase/2-hydroxyglutaryl-CoA dehydratase subunit BcrC/BadD/HgdB